MELFAAAPREIDPSSWLVGIALPLGLAFLGILMLLPRARSYPRRLGAGMAAIGLFLAGWFLVGRAGNAAETVLFYFFAAIAVVSGTLLITQVNPVHAALSFALVVLSTCGLFLLQAAPFLMAATIIVYAGAIVVTFLFVIMLAQQSGISDADHRSREPFLSALAGFALLGALLFLLERSYDNRRLAALVNQLASAANQSSAQEINQTLGDPAETFQQLRKEARLAPGTPERSALDAQTTNVWASWDDWVARDDAGAMKNALQRLADVGGRVRDRYGSLPATADTGEFTAFSVPEGKTGGMPQNVAPLGRMLFTMYLIPVELAGTLLLVATIGAIAIGWRPREGAR